MKMRMKEKKKEFGIGQKAKMLNLSWNFYQLKVCSHFAKKIDKSYNDTQYYYSKIISYSSLNDIIMIFHEKISDCFQ